MIRTNINFMLPFEQHPASGGANNTGSIGKVMLQALYLTTPLCDYAVYIAKRCVVSGGLDLHPLEIKPFTFR